MDDCQFCDEHCQGDTLYESSSGDGGIRFDYVRPIKFCPLCGKRLKTEDEGVTDGSLKPCPVCGGEAVVTFGMGCFGVSCKECSFYVPIQEYSIGEAVEAWNRRTNGRVY